MKWEKFRDWFFPFVISAGVLGSANCLHDIRRVVNAMLVNQAVVSEQTKEHENRLEKFEHRIELLEQRRR